MFPARFELATFRVWGGRDNHYTTETTVTKSSTVLIIYEINHLWTAEMNENEEKITGVNDHCHDHFFIFISFPQFIYDLFHILFINTHFFHSGFIAHLVEHHTGNREDTGSNPVEVLNFFFFFQAFLRNSA